MEEASMEASESQILHPPAPEEPTPTPSAAATSSETRPMKASLDMKDGNFLEASSRWHRSSSSPSSVPRFEFENGEGLYGDEGTDSDGEGEALWSDCDNLEADFECFFLEEGI